MAWKNFYLTAGIMSVASLPFFKASIGGRGLPDGPCIVTANHSSLLDGPLLAVLYARLKLKPLHMIAYEEPFKHWLMGYILRSSGNIPFRRGDKASQGRMLRTALGWLAAGEAVGIFPEGHINQNPRLGKPRKGAAILALEAQVPVVPTAIFGTKELFPVGAKRPKVRRSVTIRWGQPIELWPKELAYAESSPGERKDMINSLNYRIMHGIAELTGREYGEDKTHA